MNQAVLMPNKCYSTYWFAKRPRKQDWKFQSRYTRENNLNKMEKMGKIGQMTDEKNKVQSDQEIIKRG